MADLVIGGILGSVTTALIFVLVERRKLNSIYDEARATCDALIETLRAKADDD